MISASGAGGCRARCLARSGGFGGKGMRRYSGEAGRGETGGSRGVSRRRAPLLAAALSLAALGAAIAGAGALAATPDRTGAVTPASPFHWEGAIATGANTGYDSQSGSPCGKNVDNYCDLTLLNVN